MGVVSGHHGLKTAPLVLQWSPSEVTLLGFLFPFLQTSKGESKATMQRSPSDIHTLIQTTQKILKNFIWYL